MRKQPLPPSVSLSHHGPSSPRPKRTPAQTPLFIAIPRVLIEADTPLGLQELRLALIFRLASCCTADMHYSVEHVEAGRSQMLLYVHYTLPSQYFLHSDRLRHS